MKKLAILLIVLVAYCSYGQQNRDTDSELRHEVKLNAFNLITAKWLDVSYEFVLHEEASLGLGLLTALNAPEGDKDRFLDNGSLLVYKRTLSITPYYRQFFSRGYAKGFFLEAFGMLNSGTHFDYVFDDIREMTVELQEEYTNVGFGLSIGGKFVTPRGFTAEIYCGIGRNLIEDVNTPEVISRGGISLGYRF